MDEVFRGKNYPFVQIAEMTSCFDKTKKYNAMIEVHNNFPRPWYSGGEG